MNVGVRGDIGREKERDEDHSDEASRGLSTPHAPFNHIPLIPSMIGSLVLAVGSHMCTHGLPAWQSVIVTPCAFSESARSVKPRFSYASLSPRGIPLLELANRVLE
ncbi:hypothetical protein Tco_0896128 [Tanacetum coccineum]